MVGDTEEESLLFTEKDLKQPDRSQLWPELINGAKDSKVREWAAALRKSLDGPFDQVPPFDVDIFDPLRVVIKAGDWRQIHTLVTSRRYASEAFPPDVAPTVNEAFKRVKAADLFEEKVRGGRLREIASAYRPELLDGWLDPALLGKGKGAKGACELLDELDRAQKSDPTGRSFLASGTGAVKTCRASPRPTRHGARPSRGGSGSRPPSGSPRP